ncbi:MAG: secondary thiamine-phosphate synthase enzyme YjbQ [Pseudomonadota bacterium]
MLNRLGVTAQKDGLRTMHSVIDVSTHGPGLYDITASVTECIAEARAGSGLVNLFIQHTSASLVIQENADPTVLQDLRTFFDDIAPRIRAYRHNSEGDDDMPAHIRAALTQSNLLIPFEDNRLMLGSWQGVFVFEHRDRPHTRRVLATTIS